MKTVVGSLLLASLAAATSRPLKLREKQAGPTFSTRFESQVPAREFNVEPQKKSVMHSYEGCRSDYRVKALTEKDLQERNQILHWARPWKIPDNVEMIHSGASYAPKIKKIFYINAENTEREKFMETQLAEKSFGIPFARWWGSRTVADVQNMKVEGGELKDIWLYSSSGVAPYVKEMPDRTRESTIAVYLSQAGLLKHILDNDPEGEDIYVILEDDVVLDKNWHPRLVESLKTLPRDWDMAKFVYWGAKRCEDKVPGSDSWYENRGPSTWTDDKTTMYAGNQAYIVRPKGIRDILEQLRALPVMDVDGAMGSAHTEGHNVTKDHDVSWSWGSHSYALAHPLGFHRYNGVSDRTGDDDVWDPRKMIAVAGAATAAQPASSNPAPSAKHTTDWSSFYPKKLFNIVVD